MNAHPMPQISSRDLQRAQTLRWLKQISSFTTWNRILAHYRIWAAITEKMAEATTDAKTLGESDWLEIQHGLMCCEEGVGRLRRGDKRGFMYPYGDFAQASAPIRRWSRRSGLFAKRKVKVNVDGVPHWSEFNHALTRLVRAWGECSSTASVQKPETLVFLDRLVPDRGRLAIYADLLIDTLGDNAVTIAVGQKVPCSGAWEPVDLSDPASSSGDLAYLVAESTAPLPGLSLADGVVRHWRLFWEDVRYKDAILPLEEFAYFSGA